MSLWQYPIEAAAPPGRLRAFAQRAREGRRTRGLAFVLALLGGYATAWTPILVLDGWWEAGWGVVDIVGVTAISVRVSGRARPLTGKRPFGRLARH